MQKPEWYDGNVSRETLLKLTEFSKLLRKWTKKINLVSHASLEHLETRHIWDSAQIYEPTGGVWVDVGSGGGLPGVVVAILAQGEGRVLRTVLIESDQRKAIFLRTCARELAIPMVVLTERIENVEPVCADYVSARALADLDHLLLLTSRHLKKNGKCLFMKGQNWQEEVRSAKKNWRFDCEARPSQTHPQAVILKIKDIERV